jgi:biofilm PGA synthesis N-glycosyltransferase PgaC
MEAVFLFVFLYPLVMAGWWMIGALVFFVRRERGESRLMLPERLPRVAILVPCHNEELVIRDTIEHLDKNHYPDFEIIAIDDGSTDRTGAILAELATRIRRLRIVTLTRNYGKAMALRAGAFASTAEYLMCIDADALLDRDALFWMIRHFLDGPRVGAVTGNPRVLNRSSLLGRIQIGEFSAIIGMIKRTQRGVGRIFTVSGVNACFRRRALVEVGYWSPETVTEDIDVSWKLQLHRWDIRYEANALTWILVPERLRALWRQRLRWAQGGVEAAVKYAREVLRWPARRMWPVYAEYWVGVLWCYAFALTVVCWAGTNFLPAGVWPAAMAVPTLVPGWTGVLLGLTCLAQFTVGLYIDSHYEKRGLMRYLFWAIWYPAVYWLINTATTVVAVPKGLRQYKQRRYAVWKSPVRRLKDLFLWLHAARQPEQRHLYVESVSWPRVTGWAEWLLTLIFWGLWVYLVSPLLSLLLWFLGISLFVDRMIRLGGYQSLAQQLGHYSATLLALWALMTAWVWWNQHRYGRHDRRGHFPPPITIGELAKSVGVTPEVIVALQGGRQIFMHYDANERPVIERLEAA